MPFSTPQAIAIYEAFPRKVAKPVALQKIMAAINKYGFETVMKNTQAFAERYKALGTPKEKIPHPATFFYQERYMDELDEALPLPLTAGRPSAAPGVPLWQQIKATEGLLEQNKAALDRCVWPEKSRYEWKNGHNARFDHDYKMVFEKREALKNHRAELQRRLTTLQEQAIK